jgi:hypothetical protein
VLTGKLTPDNIMRRRLFMVAKPRTKGTMRYLYSLEHKQV